MDALATCQEAGSFLAGPVPTPPSFSRVTMPEAKALGLRPVPTHRMPSTPRVLKHPWLSQPGGSAPGNPAKPIRHPAQIGVAQDPPLWYNRMRGERRWQAGQTDSHSFAQGCSDPRCRPPSQLTMRAPTRLMGLHRCRDTSSCPSQYCSIPSTFRQACARPSAQ
jgi:hypothetical protein